MNPTKEGYFTGTNGLELFYQCWLPDGTPKAILMILHGVGEHGGRYTNLVKGLLPQGYGLYALDHRGHGRSPGQRGHIMSWLEYRADTQAFQKFIAGEHPGLEIFTYGHSMGALMALDFITHQPEGVKGAVVSGVPFEPVGVGTPFLRVLVRVLSNIKPDFSAKLDIHAEHCSSIPEVIQDGNNDPLCHGYITARWGTESMKTNAWVSEHPDEIRTPVLMVHGRKDPLNLVRGAEAYFEGITFPDKAIKIYENSLHEPHNDIESDQFTKDVAEWLEGHL